MIRVLHRWPGLLALALVTVLALSGAMLSVFPALERLTAPQADAGLSVAQLASRIQTAYPGVEQIRRAPSGRIKAYWFDGGTPGAAVIDPATGLGVASADPIKTQRWLTDFHRGLFLGDGGRITTALGAAAMLVLSLSGAVLVARRTGGWRRWFARLRGPLAGRLHVEVARISVLGFVISSITALWMTASTFDLLPNVTVTSAIPSDVSGQLNPNPSGMAVLQKTPVTQMRELTYPYPGDVTDVYTLKTNNGSGYIDQGTGQILVWDTLSQMDRLTEVIYMLHTGQGAIVLGLLLGVLSLGVPLMGATGVVVWLVGRRGRPRIKGNHPASKAETVLLIGSEGGSTWGFAATLHKALSEAGQSVHAAPMSGFDPARYGRATRVVVLAATYGDGDAPASAKGFLDRLQKLDHAPNFSLAVLGFGDRSFPAYCAFGDAVVAAAKQAGWAQLIPYDTVDCQSPQDFARWGRSLGRAMGIDLDLAHQPVVPKSRKLTLISRRDYGAEVQAPTAILRFALPKQRFWQGLTARGFGRFRAGDLLGILPEGSTVPRFYSLASAHRDGFVEIVVKKHPGGLCSGQLFCLEPGDAINVFLRPNPEFKPGRGHSPLILIGAGTGLGPLAGFVRGNGRRRPIHLFFGMRHPESDFLFAEEIANWQAEGRIARTVTAVSRGAGQHYVQDALRAEASEVAQLIRDGARIMVCGGRDMAGGVAAALVDILAPVGLTPVALKAEGRYVEDVY